MGRFISTILTRRRWAPDGMNNTSIDLRAKIDYDIEATRASTQLSPRLKK